MSTVLDSIRSIIGQPAVMVNGSLDYGALLEYFGALLILCVVIASVFRFIGKLVK